MKKILVAVIMLISADLMAQDWINRQTPLDKSEYKVKMALPLNANDIQTGYYETEFDFKKPNTLEQFLKGIVQLQSLGNLHKDEKKQKGDAFVEPPFFLSKDKRKTLDEIERLIGEINDAPLNEALWIQLLELTSAFRNNFRYPIRRNYEAIEVPFIIISSFANPVKLDQGKSATNLMQAPEGTPKSFEDLIDPVPSSFWKPSEVAKKDLYVGFGRLSLPDVSKPCSYDSPKKGYGAHGGFHVLCKNAEGREVEVKLRLGEERHSTPFNTRIFWALGYNTVPIDYVEALEVKPYDRRILTQFNMRKQSGIRVNLFRVIPLFKRDIQKPLNPFEFIKDVTLINGEKITAEQLQTGLLRPEVLKIPVNPKGPRPEADPKNYRKDAEQFEATIESITMKPASIVYDSDKHVTAGAWHWDEFDHADRRELRAVFMLAAWLSAYDLRWENTRIQLVKNIDDQLELQHIFSDVGSGLGNSSSMKDFYSGVVNEFEWKVTNRDANRLIFPGFNVFMGNKAFKRMNFEDARWMVRLLAQLTPEQITQALIASGFSAAEVKMYLEKLVSRRNKMIMDLNLGGVLPILKTEDEKFNFDPLQTPIVDTVLGKNVDPRGLLIRQGKVMDRKTGRSIGRGH